MLPRPVIDHSLVALILACSALGAVPLHAQVLVPYHCGQDAWVVGALEGPTRDWTPANTAKGPGLAHGGPFRATVLRVWNEDTPFSSEMAVFRLTGSENGGCVRAFKTASFRAEDLAVLHDFRNTERGVEELVPATDGAAREAAAFGNSHTLDSRPSHTADFSGAFAARKAAKANVYETQHFALWWGNDRSHHKEVSADPDFIRRAGAWLEVVWAHYDYVDRAPMPHADEAKPARINVSLYGTGLPWLPQDGFANSGDSMALSPAALFYGSSVVAHEFCHVIQTYTRGFRESSSVGEFWETHANFGAFSFEPTFADSLAIFLPNLHQGIFWAGARYANYPFLLQLWEKKRTSNLVFDIWTQNKRDRTGKTLEDPAEALVRLGQESGAFPRGWASFGDEVGEYASRLVAMDFVNQKFMLSAVAPTRAKSLTNLLPVQDSGWSMVPPERAPAQFGITHIRLVPKMGTKELRVSVRGLVDTRRASWRATLVALDANDRARYSVMARISARQIGTVTLDVRAGESYTLAIAATPEQWERIPWDRAHPDGTSQTRFPYEVKIDEVIQQ